jgi:hypothetical protein
MKQKTSFLGIYPQSFVLALMVLTMLLSTACDPTVKPGGGTVVLPPVKDSVKVETFPTKEAVSKPERVSGAKYPAYKIDTEREPNSEDSAPPLPDGPKRGEMKPSNQEFKLREARIKGLDQGENKREESAAALAFKRYADVTNIPTNTCCPEVSVAEAGQTVMLTANTWAAFSTNGGASFNVIDVTTLFPRSEGGFCCDQVLLYAPKINNFLWLSQYWRLDGAGINRIRLAVATPEEIAQSGGTAWTYWDFTSDVIGDGSWLDYSDMGLGDNNLYIAVNSVGRGRVVARLPLESIQARTSISYRYTPPTLNSYFSAISQDTGNEAFWGGFTNNSTMRIFNWTEGSTTFSSRTLPINSFPNGASSGTKCPDGVDWSNFWAQGNNWEGCARSGDQLWVSWPAPEGGGFPQVHIQMARVNVRTWRVEEQMQIWNPDFAFKESNLATNSRGEVGIDVAFGGGSTFYANNAVGVWGDFVVYYPRLSNVCTTRWGDYSTVRRVGPQGTDWCAAGYVNTSSPSGVVAVPHYIQFGRP